MDILKPDLKLFKEKYDSGTKQVLFTSFAADVHTPISSLLKLLKEKYLFLFESVERGSRKGRYSVIGLKPDLIWECKDGISKIKKWTGPLQDAWASRGMGGEKHGFGGRLLSYFYRMNDESQRHHLKEKEKEEEK